MAFPVRALEGYANLKVRKAHEPYCQVQAGAIVAAHADHLRPNGRERR